MSMKTQLWLSEWTAQWSQGGWHVQSVWDGTSKVQIVHPNSACEWNCSAND